MKTLELNQMIRKLNFRFIIVQSLVGLLFFSCNLNELESTESQYDQKISATELIKPEEYGNYHNMILGVYLSNKEFTDSSSDLFSKGNDLSSFRDMVVSIKENVEKVNPELINEYEYSLAIIDEVFVKLKANKAVSMDYRNVTKELIDIKSNNALNPFFKELLNNDTQYSHETILNKVSALEKSGTLSDEDKIQLTKFVSTYESSRQLWTEYLKSKGGKQFMTSKCDPTEQVYLADAFGTLLGVWGSIGYSYSVYKLQDNGTHCI